MVTKRDKNFDEVQGLVTLRLGMTTAPMNDQMELPRMLSQFVSFVEL